MSGYNYEADEKWYEKFVGKTLEEIKQLDNQEIYIKFDDETVIRVSNKGIHHDDIHLKIYEI